ncbi:hypothetical protein AB0X98_06400 [Rothia koreensis]|uniref:hypothetical protein n=1 Tax=Rothia koreensis TaxID=592378 RepID=UPI003F214B33
MNTEDYQHVRESLFGPAQRPEEWSPTETETEAGTAANDQRQQIADTYGVPASFVYGNTPEQMRQYAQRLAEYQSEQETVEAPVITAQGQQSARATEQANPIRQLLNPESVRSEQARLPQAE